MKISSLLRIAVVAATMSGAGAMAQTSPSTSPPAATPPAATSPAAPPAAPAPPQALPPQQAAPPLTLTVDEFRRELVGIPLCGTPATGPFAGKQLCTVHLPDGTAVVAGAGLVVRGVWEGETGKICRRNAHDAIEKRRCVEYERLAPDRYRNSDGVEFCLGPCPN